MLEPAGRDEKDDEDLVEDEDDAPCLLCMLIDNDDEEPLRVRLARAMAYGDLVLAKGNGVSTCEDCDEAIDDELRDLEKTLRRSKPRRRD